MRYINLHFTYLLTYLLTGDCHERLCDTEMDSATIADKLNKMQLDKAAGDDNISPRLLRPLAGRSLLFR